MRPSGRNGGALAARAARELGGAELARPCGIVDEQFSMASVLQYRMRWWATLAAIVVEAVAPWFAALIALGALEWLTAKSAQHPMAWWMDTVLNVGVVAVAYIWWLGRGDRSTMVRAAPASSAALERAHRTATPHNPSRRMSGAAAPSAAALVRETRLPGAGHL